MANFLLFTHQHPFLISSALLVLWFIVVFGLSVLIATIFRNAETDPDPDPDSYFSIAIPITWVLFNFLIYFLFSPSTCKAANPTDALQCATALCYFFNFALSCASFFAYIL